MKKFMKINETEKGEYSIEDLIEMYTPYIRQKASFYLDKLRKFGQAHSLYVDFEDLEQIAIIGLIKAYDVYDINFKTEGYDNSNDPIGFFPIMDKKVKGEISRFIRDSLLLRRKDYEIYNISLSSLDKPISSKKDDGNDMSLLESLNLHDKDVYEDIDNKIEVESLMSCLDEQSKVIVENYYFHNKTQVQIASMLGISQVHVSRTLNKSIKKMKNYSESLSSEENEVMKNRKTIDFDDLIKYLEKSKDSLASLDAVITTYCCDNNLELKDVYNALERRKASYDKIKALYKKTSIEAIKEKEVVIKPKVKVQKDKKPVKKEVNPIEEKASNDLNALKDIDILNLTANVNGLSVEFSKEGINLYDFKVVGLTVEDLIKLQENIQKVIEINNTLYQ